MTKKSSSHKTVFFQRTHPIPENYKWAFVLISIALLAVAAIIADKANEKSMAPPQVIPNQTPTTVSPTQNFPILADEKFQAVMDLKPIPGKYVYNGKMPFRQALTNTPASAPTDFATILQQMSNQQPTTTPPAPVSTTTTMRDFSYVAFADAYGFVGVKSAAPSSGNILMDLFLTATIQPTIFRIGDEVLGCPLNVCVLMREQPIEFPTFYSLLPTPTKTKTALLGVPFKYVGEDKVNGRACDLFEAGNGNTFQSVCVDQQTHVPSSYKNGYDYTMELTTIQTTDYLIESSYPNSFVLDHDKSSCAINSATGAKEATVTFLPIKSSWVGIDREVEVKFYDPAQNPVIYPAAIPTMVQTVDIAGKRGEFVTYTFPIANATSNQYSVRLCVGGDCTGVFNCAFASTPGTITAEQCTNMGGEVLGNPGGGISCPAGQREIGFIPLGIEGSICCK